MIRKFGYVDVCPEMVSAVFADTENWSEWMPGVENIEVLDSKAGYSRVAVSHRFQGRKFDQDLECTFSESAVSMRQSKGFFQKWQSNWWFLKPPDGMGTTLKCDIDMKVGGMAAFVASKRMIDSFLDGYFREIVSSLEARVNSVMEKRSVTDKVPTNKDVLLQIFQTERGLEMWFDGGMHLLTARTDN